MAAEQTPPAQGAPAKDPNTSWSSKPTPWHRRTGERESLTHWGEGMKTPEERQKAWEKMGQAGKAPTTENQKPEDDGLGGTGVNFSPSSGGGGAGASRASGGASSGVQTTHGLGGMNLAGRAQAEPQFGQFMPHYNLVPQVKPSWMAGW